MRITINRFFLIKAVNRAKSCTIVTKLASRKYSLINQLIDSTFSKSLRHYPNHHSFQKIINETLSIA